MPGSPSPEAGPGQASDPVRVAGPTGYTYWVRGGESAAAPAPIKALSAEQAAALPSSTATAGGASAWNAAGTWEDRDCSGAARARLRARLEGLAVRGGGDGAPLVALTSLDSVEGEATLTIVRGVRRAGFDFDVTMKWESSGSGGGGGGGDAATTTAGTARIPNLASDELDDLRVEDVVVTTGTSVPAGFAAAVARAVGEAVEGLAAELVA